MARCADGGCNSVSRWQRAVVCWICVAIASGFDLACFIVERIPLMAPDERRQLVALMNEIDGELPVCHDNAYQMKAYLRPDDLLTPIAEGKLVVISRGMFRLLRDAIDGEQ